MEDPKILRILLSSFCNDISCVRGNEIRKLGGPNYPGVYYSRSSVCKYYLETLFGYGRAAYLDLTLVEVVLAALVGQFNDTHFPNFLELLFYLCDIFRFLHLVGVVEDNLVTNLDYSSQILFYSLILIPTVASLKVVTSGFCSFTTL